MLTEIYIEALLVDEELADQVWEAWDKGEIDDLTACAAWWRVAMPTRRATWVTVAIRMQQIAKLERELTTPRQLLL